MTCVQLMKYFPEGEHGKKKEIRLKVYNKSEHLLTASTVKTWLGMNSRALFKGDQAFYYKKI
jgi:hypothetical protein